MKFTNQFLLIIVVTVGLYGIFLIFSDFNALSNKILDFKTIYVPIVVGLVTLSWLPIYIRWILLLKNLGIHIPIKKNFEIYLAGFALTITPVKVGELIRSQLLKEDFGVPRTKTAPLVLVEKLYDLGGAIIISIPALWIFSEAGYVIIAGAILLITLLLLMSSKKLFNKFNNFCSKSKFIAKYTLNISDSYDVIRNSLWGKITIYSLLLSISYWLVISLAIYYILLAFSITDIGYLNTLVTYTASLILGALSFIPGGIGVAEGSLVGLFSLQGITTSTAIIISIVIRLLTLWYTVAVGFVALKLSGKFRINNKDS